ncbi:hypothetical protein GCM10008994_12370 [Halorubrum ejinorense]|uniref:Uncharacterized protein n=1 Tax=Halorubrum ejinorense TaxID=425309 RepID=A0AAV3SPQ0_9EURY
MRGESPSDVYAIEIPRIGSQFTQSSGLCGTCRIDPIRVSGPSEHVVKQQRLYRRHTEVSVYVH